MATHGKIGEFDPSQETWAMYVERLELYFIANGIEDAGKKRAVLLTVSGASTYKLIRNLSAPIKPAEKSFDDLVALLKSHYTPKPSVIMQRFQFHSRTQRPGETVAAFVAELRQLSEFCEFGATLEDMLRDRLVCGIASSAIQRRLLAEPDLTLKKAQDLAQAIESADKNVKDLQGQRQPPVSTTVHAVTPRQGASNPKRPWARTDVGKTPDTQCHRCGGKHSPHSCRFKTAECHSCKRRGHLARMCRTKRTQSAAAGRQGGGKPPLQQTQLIESEQQPRNSRNDGEAYTLFTVNSERASPIEVKVRANGVPMTMELDTGAVVSVIGENTYLSTWPHDPPPLQPSTIELHTYSGEELKVLGSITVTVDYQGQQEELPLLVVKGSGASLMGRNWLQKIRLDLRFLVVTRVWREVYWLRGKTC